MTSTEINGAIGLATFLVITITAVAAVIQLRHLRRANELEGLLSVLARVEDMGFQSWNDETRRLVAEQMPDPAYRRSILEGTFERSNNPWLQLVNSYEWLGSLVRRGLIPEDPIMDVYSGRIISAWKSVESIIAVARRRPENASLLENFEYLYVRSTRYLSHNPSTYPAHMPRAEIHDTWAEADGIAVKAIAEVKRD